LAQDFGAGTASTDETHLTIKEINPVYVCTRHNDHARQALTLLKADKSVWIEKPLALKLSDLDEIEKIARKSKGILMVGFNRRFAPATEKLLKAIENKPESKKIHMTINAGRLDSEHWTLDPQVGGGRIVGEACHFIDLSVALINQRLVSIQCTRRDSDGQDGGCFELNFADGSTSIIDYRTDLPPKYPKKISKSPAKHGQPVYP
jgi:predicted dehydrogenase